MSVLQGSPFTHGHRNTGQIMRMVCYAMVPGILCQLYWFGWGTLIQIVLAVIAALVEEGLVLWLRQRPLLPSLSDGSALVTGLLLAVSIPPLSPWWLIVLGTFFAIVMVKQIYGGLGANLFNPAMAGYVLLLIAFPVLMTTWMPARDTAAYHFDLLDTLQLIFTDFTGKGYSLQQAAQWLDGTTAATPLDTLKTGFTQGMTTTQIAIAPVFNQWAGVGWSWVNLAYLLGGLALLQQRIINWHIPFGFLSMLLLCSTLGYLLHPQNSTPIQLNLLSGATMLGAFFIATDPVSASTTQLGRIIYGALMGLLVYVIRTWGGYPDAIAFSALLANMTVPLIDHFTRPRTYGHGGERQ